MQINERIDAVLKLQLAVNFLKLCADHENPVGGGVPVDIVAMPDFVVDVDGYAVTELNKSRATNRLAAAEVGSRAGRILSILAHLRDLDDEGFQLHYIAKTGAVGRAVLNKRLRDDLRDKHLEPLSFPLLTPSMETRYAVLGRKERTPQDRPVPDRQIVLNKDVLTQADLRDHFYSPVSVLSNASAVYFGADSPEQFAELCELVVLGPSAPAGDCPANRTANDRFVFLDLSAMLDRPKEASTCLETLGHLSRDAYVHTRTQLLAARKGDDHRHPYASGTRLVVIVAPCGLPLDTWWCELGLEQGKDIQLAYDQQYMHVKDSAQGTVGEPVPVAYGLRPSERDAFVAGLLLHRAVAAAWGRIPPLQRMKHVLQSSDQEVAIWRGDWSHGLLPNPYSDSGTCADPWPLSQAIGFAKALANLWRARDDDGNEPPDRRTLLLENLSAAEQDHCRRVSMPAPSVLEEKRNAAVDADDINPNKCDYQWLWFLCKATLLTNDWLADNILPAGDASVFPEPLREWYGTELNFTPQLWVEAGNLRSHALSLPSIKTILAQFVLDLLRRMSMHKPWQPNATNRTCLLDLDGTLIQSSGLRGVCLRRAFLAMLFADGESGFGEAHDRFPALPGNLLENLRQRLNGAWIPCDVPTLLHRCDNLYHHIVYNRWKDWAELLHSYPYHLLGKLSKNFRQVWNHPLSYVVFTQVLMNRLDKGQPRRFCHPLPVSPVAVMIRACSDDCYNNIIAFVQSKDDDGNYIMRARQLLSSERPVELRRTLAVWEAKHTSVFQAAVRAHWDVDYGAIPYTRELLRTLRDVLGVRLYVATEGHHDTQLRKLRAVGLDAFFPDPRVMSTGAAATAAEHVRIIDDALDTCQAKLQHATRDCATFADLRLKRIHALVAEHPEADARIGPIIDGDAEYKRFTELQCEKNRHEHELKEEERCLKSFKGHWEDYQRKDMGAIYSLMIACVMVDPDRPFLFLTNLAELNFALRSRHHKLPSLSLRHRA